MRDQKQPKVLNTDEVIPIDDDDDDISAPVVVKEDLDETKVAAKKIEESAEKPSETRTTNELVPSTDLPDQLFESQANLDEDATVERIDGNDKGSAESTNDTEKEDAKIEIPEKKQTEDKEEAMEIDEVETKNEEAMETEEIASDETTTEKTTSDKTTDKTNDKANDKTTIEETTIKEITTDKTTIDETKTDKTTTDVIENVDKQVEKEISKMPEETKTVEEVENVANPAESLEAVIEDLMEQNEPKTKTPSAELLEAPSLETPAELSETPKNLLDASSDVADEAAAATTETSSNNQTD